MKPRNEKKPTPPDLGGMEWRGHRVQALEGKGPDVGMRWAHGRNRKEAGVTECESWRVWRMEKEEW